MRLVARLLIFALGVLAGAAAGIPGVVERVGERAERAVERVLRADVELEDVAWSLSGDVILEGVTVTERGAPSEDPPLLRVDRIALTAETLVLDRKVRIHRVEVRGLEVSLGLRADGTVRGGEAARGVWNMLHGQGQGGGQGSRLKDLLDPHVPQIDVRGLAVHVDTGRGEDSLIPGRVSWTRGRAHGRNTALLKEDDNLTVNVRFEHNSLDPGYGVDITTVLKLAGGDAPVRLAFDRPVRAGVGERSLGLGGLTWDSRGLGVEGLTLSQVTDGADERGKAGDPDMSIRRIELDLDVEALVSQAGTGLLAPTAEGARMLVGRVVRAMRIDRPTLVFEDRPMGHSLTDLVPGIVPGAAGHAPETPEHALGPLMEATRKAILAQTPKDSDRSGRGVRGFLVRGAMRLERAIGTVSRTTLALGRAFPVADLEVRGGHFVWRDVLVHDPSRADLAGRLENFDLNAKRRGRIMHFDASFVAPGTERSANEVKGKIHLDTGDVELRASIEHLGLAAYGQVFPVSVPVAQDTRLHDTDVWVAWSPATGIARLGGRFGIENANFYYRPLAQDILSGISLSVDFEAQLDTARKTLALDPSRLTIGEMRSTVRLDIEDYGDLPRLSGALRLDRTRCQDVFDAMPGELLPLLEGLQVEGTLAWQLDFSLDTGDMDSLTYNSYPEINHFRVTDMGKRLSLDAVRGTFLHRIHEADGTIREMFIGPGLPNWVSLENIREYVVKAVTTTEDGSFFKHKGFSPFHIRRSIVTNLKKGGFYRGASTVTQQLVKNLFLSREKTISRKLQELFITAQLEGALDKKRIMELYLNIIEFGPGIYGIRPASKRYFNKEPYELSLVESVFLVSIIPSPRKHFSEQIQPGEVTDHWRRHLRWIIGKMKQRKKITEAEYAAAAPYAPIFYRPEAEQEEATDEDEPETESDEPDAPQGDAN